MLLHGGPPSPLSPFLAGAQQTGHALLELSHLHRDGALLAKGRRAHAQGLPLAVVWLATDCTGAMEGPKALQSKAYQPAFCQAAWQLDARRQLRSSCAEAGGREIQRSSSAACCMFAQIISPRHGHSSSSSSSSSSRYRHATAASACAAVRLREQARRQGARGHAGLTEGVAACKHGRPASLRL